MVAAMSHSCRHTPGVVGGGGAGVVVVVEINRRVVGSVLISGSEVEAVAFLCSSRSRSIENGVVEGEGQPVNSVEALSKKIYYILYNLAKLKFL